MRRPLYTPPPLYYPNNPEAVPIRCNGTRQQQSGQNHIASWPRRCCQARIFAFLGSGSAETIGSLPIISSRQKGRDPCRGRSITAQNDQRQSRADRGYGKDGGNRVVFFFL